MATLAHPPAAVGVPWLEHFPTDGGPAQKTLLGKLPFTIGRNDACDLPIRSNRVSREHAAVIRTGDAFRIRDLDSTNGTFLNGQRIEEATLTDGDVVVFADVEFRYFSGAAEARRTTVTQVIGFREREPTGKASGGDVLRALRRLQESLLQASARLDYLPWIDLASGQAAAFEALLAPSGSDPAAEAERGVLAASARLASRIRDSQWMVAARAVSRVPGASLAVRIEAPDVAAEACQESLARLAGVLPGERVVALVPDSLVIDMPHFHEFHGRLRGLGLRIAYGDFAAGKAQFEVHRRAPPDLVKLARSMLKHLSSDPERQRQVASVVRACRELGAEVIAADVSTAEEARVCRELGCRYASGSHWGGPLPVVPDLAARSPAAGRKVSASTAFSP